MRRRKRRSINHVLKQKRKRPCFYSKLACIVDGDMVSIETRCQGRRIVIACNTYEKVDVWVDSLKQALRYKVYPELASTQKRKAVAEAEDILGES